MGKLPRFIMEPDKKPFHSSGYAEAASGDSLGATSSQSFEQRQAIDKLRSAVASYGQSMIASGQGRQPGERLRVPNRQATQVGSPRPDFASSQPDKKPIDVPARQQFREPPSRGYNPYA